MRIPNWVQELTLKVLIDNNCENIPEIICRKSRHIFDYSGTADNERITLRFGKKCEMWKKKMTLLHELAHWLRPISEGHSTEFWKLAFNLYKTYGVPIRKALKNERGYKKGAENGYRLSVGKSTKKISRKRKEIHSLDKLPIYAVIGIKKDYKGKSWAVSRFTGFGALQKWNGYKISDGLYNKLKKGGYKEV